MTTESTTNKIMERMISTKEGIIYTNSDFYDLGSPDAIRKSLSRLSNHNKIYRLIDGFYTIPAYIDIIKEYSYPSPDQLANKIADKYMWNITPNGDTALNEIGISTQVPNVCEYISDGPYREFKYFNMTIKFKHTSNRYVSQYSKPVALIIQSIKAVGKDQITDKQMKIIASYVDKYVSDNMLEEAKSVPVWIYEIIKRINKEEIHG